MNGTRAAAKHSLPIRAKQKRAIEHARPHSGAGAPKGHAAARAPRNLFRAWGEIAPRIRNAEICALLLDFDGTLVSCSETHGKYACRSAPGACSSGWREIPGYSSQSSADGAVRTCKRV